MFLLLVFFFFNDDLVGNYFEDYVEYDAQAQSCFCMSEFKLNQAESEAIVKLQSDIFNCMILKYVHLNSTDCKLPGLQSLIIVLLSKHIVVKSLMLNHSMNNSL